MKARKYTKIVHEWLSERTTVELKRLRTHPRYFQLREEEIRDEVMKRMELIRSWTCVTFDFQIGLQHFQLSTGEVMYKVLRYEVEFYVEFGKDDVVKVYKIVEDRSS